jgi:hypothetical protein
MPIKQGEKNKKIKQQETKDKSMEELLRQNLETMNELQEKVNKVYKYIKWQRAFFGIKILIILIPLILSIIYLPAILQNFIAPYQELLGGVQDLSGGIDINSLLR